MLGVRRRVGAGAPRPVERFSRGWTRLTGFPMGEPEDRQALGPDGAPCSAQLLQLLLLSPSACTTPAVLGIGV